MARPAAGRATPRLRPAIAGLERRVLLSDGVLDPTFGIGGKQVVPFQLNQSTDNRVFAMAMQGDKIVLVGRAATPRSINGASGTAFAVARLNADGTLDPTFGQGGEQVISFDLAGAGSLDEAHAVAIAPDGKIVLAGPVQVSAGGGPTGGVAAYDFGIARLIADGSLDQTFNGNGKQVISFHPNGGVDVANAVVVQPDGRLVVGGTIGSGQADTDFGVARLNGDGTPDTDYGTGGKTTVAFNLGATNNDELNALALNPFDGGVVLAGSAAVGSTTPGVPASVQFAVAWLRPDGKLEDGQTAGAPGGKTTINVAGDGSMQSAQAVLVQSNGWVDLAGGAVVGGGTSSRITVARLDYAGRLDNSFAQHGRESIAVALSSFTGNATAWALAEAPGKKLLIAGQAEDDRAGQDMAVVRLNEDGSLDQTFGVKGEQTVPFDSAGTNDDIARGVGVGIQASGKVVLGGTVQLGGTAAGQFNIAAARLGPTPGTPVDVPTTARDDAYATPENHYLYLTYDRGDVLVNDSGPAGRPLNSTLVLGPAHGTLAFDSFGEFTYQPNNNYVGTDSFTYRADDGTALSNTATVTITVHAIDRTPSAVDDAYIVDEDHKLLVDWPGVLANDTDPDGDLLYFDEVSKPLHGMMELGSGYQFTYQPYANFNGTDSFTYRVDDGTLTSLATVTITVRPVDDPPVANPDTYLVAKGSTLNVSSHDGVLRNDTDLDSPHLIALRKTDPSHGTLTLNKDGSFHYTPTGGFTGDDSFQYRANDGSLDSKVATVTLHVTPPPQVLRVQLARVKSTVHGRQVTSTMILVTFSEDMDANRAAQRSSYQVAITETHRVHKKTVYVYDPVNITAARYDPRLHVTTLTLSVNPKFPKGGRFIASASLTDRAGNKLDGNRDGKGGDVATLDFPKG
jgi:uncharacterized delta-60 repeat protein